jgi:GH15 family glucan-1,4-alpha-glucosidase
LYPSDASSGPSRIEDYALIGDCTTAALVSRTGAIDWLCWPRFDSAACFAALLGTTDHGTWRIAPSHDNVSVERSYRDGSPVLETVFSVPEGKVALIDFMPVGTRNSSVIRLVEGRGGRVNMHMHLALRFDYGASVPWVTRLEDNTGICAIAGPEMTVLRTPVSLEGEDMTTQADFVVSEGETVPFVLTHSPSHLKPPKAVHADGALAETLIFWKRWSKRGSYVGEYQQAVSRSLVTLKALTFQQTGGIVAAATTSLPEQLGGTRNWDYRFCWLRDATITLLAFMDGGYFEEAQAWREWLHRSIAGSPDQVQIMYGVAGERRLAEWEVDWLPGYQGAAPVRIGNAASSQLQLDVYGEVMDALHHARAGGLAAAPESWDLQREMVEHLETIWDQPDEGIWETRGGRRNFTFSKVNAWVALDRSIRSAESFNLKGPLERWNALRTQMHQTICSQGFDSENNTFTQSFGSRNVDASLLMIPLVGFLPPSDPRVKGTVAAIERELLADGFVKRYDTSDSSDGLPPGEGAFLACSFWLADNYVLQGRMKDAKALFERLLDLRNDVGLLSEEYDPRACRLVGNFPQAFSHVALVGTAVQLSKGEGAEARRKPRNHHRADAPAS